MTSDVIRSILQYNKWATERVLDRAANLPSEQLLAEDDTPWGSIRNQLVHVFNVHRSWLSWVDGSLPPEEAYRLQDDPADYPNIECLRDLWARVSHQTDAYLNRMTDEELQRVLSVQWPHASFEMPVWKIMLHIANHSMQHRTETAMSLTRLGQSPGDLDYIFYAMREDAPAAS